jgi:hypothetical protein
VNLHVSRMAVGLGHPQGKYTCNCTSWLEETLPSHNTLPILWVKIMQHEVVDGVATLRQRCKYSDEESSLPIFCLSGSLLLFGNLCGFLRFEGGKLFVLWLPVSNCMLLCLHPHDMIARSRVITGWWKGWSP